MTRRRKIRKWRRTNARGHHNQPPMYLHGCNREGSQFTYCTPMEVVLCTQDNGFIFWDALDFVSPFAGDFDTCLDSLGAGVHGHHHIKAKVAGNELGKAREDIIVECTGAQSYSRSLVYQCRNQFGVAVALVHSRVG